MTIKWSSSLRAGCLFHEPGHLFGKPVYPDSKVHGAKMELIWSRRDAGGPHAGPMNVAIWVVFRMCGNVSCMWSYRTWHRCHHEQTLRIWRWEFGEMKIIGLSLDDLWLYLAAKNVWISINIGAFDDHCCVKWEGNLKVMLVYLPGIISRDDFSINCF